MNEPLTDGWQSNGKHLGRFEPPDIYHSLVRGDIDAPEVIRTHERLLQYTRDAGVPLFWMVDVSEIGRVLPAASRVDNPELDLRALLIVGASFRQRVLVTLGVKAHRLLFRRLLSLPIEFFPNEAAARAWLECERTKTTPHEAGVERASPHRTR
ncbi:hypothetical protein [Polyangium aurulentum]|uniref:hypothetical protein n=1 Tax=Polyangium aurulentum TaxID=2567896 RepID=UPI0010AE46A4|nr:hypothetical protein [Polyangium aurulentum]UQA56498.1 hypothetical protein E8A73_035060 [Polyangium aurulentum]